MKKCMKCGKELSDIAKFCPNCGCPVGEAQNTPPLDENSDPAFGAGAAAPQFGTAAQQTKPNDFLEALKNPKNRTAEMNTEDISLNNRLAVLSYLGIFFVIPGFLVKKSPYCKFHANQGLLLFLIGILLTVIRSVIRRPLMMVRFLKPIVGLIFTLARLCLLALRIIGMIHAGKGEAKELPFIGSVRIIK